MPVTYTQPLRPKSPTCSCCGANQYPWTALCYTGPDDVVTWVLCRQCEAVCGRFHNRLGQVKCPITPCRELEGKGEVNCCGREEPCPD
jgi:hypothetical protein